MSTVLLILALCAAPGAEPTTVLSDPRLLAEWDRDATSPLSLAKVFERLHADQKLDAPAPAEKGRPSSGALLLGYTRTWGVVASTFKGDLDRIVTELGLDWEKDITKTYDVTAAKTELGKDKWHRGNGNVVRVFDEKWLSSPDGQFALSGVVYRPDRRDFSLGSCGELRLLYRLAYEVTMNGKIYASRMPFAVNVVFRVPWDPDQSCKSYAPLWRSEPVTSENAAALAASLLRGPLDLSRVVFQQIELNAQVARFPSDLENVDRRKFAGQAAYWLRIFALHGDHFSPMKLENTPDVAAIEKDPAKKKALVEAITTKLNGIDLGVFVLPDVLLADVAISWSTLGSARLANRPFDRLFTSAEADALVAAWKPLRPPAFVTSGSALLERLNGASCMGCHQTASTAGFHFLGVDREYGADPAAVKLATDGNRLQLPFSPHFYAESPRRLHYLAALASGREPNRVRPDPAAPPAIWSEGGPRYSGAATSMPCLLEPRHVAPSAAWSCAPGLECKALVSSPASSFALGQCLPAAEKLEAGLACRAGVLTEAKREKGDGLAFNVRAFQDRVVKEESIWPIGEDKLTDSAYNCRPSKIGVPLGRITRQCKKEERPLAGLGASAREVCAVVGGKGFEEMARGYFDSERFAAGVGRGLLDTCTPARFCREDYICQQLPDFLASKKHGVSKEQLAAIRAAQVGFCTPTYFVYQLRLDGHPNPR